ncbi:hypothetical protein BU23DRAFT_193128 [Bimuria novae-zelandiae CBS 107.79]|uniref:Uncharacterized protein n=1 Tax=Bimuria novae-zelandiae CBS 107.79 TaxID=1447943 RepID=A0A6A5VP26_9PLEO|nr:hypothetical protein BU23DRAFT_193128 [Bimuria novae-zelandiae CBS 107.79]
MLQEDYFIHLCAIVSRIQVKTGRALTYTLQRQTFLSFGSTPSPQRLPLERAGLIFHHLQHFPLVLALPSTAPCSLCRASTSYSSKLIGRRDSIKYLGGHIERGYSGPSPRIMCRKRSVRAPTHHNLYGPGMNLLSSSQQFTRVTLGRTSCSPPCWPQSKSVAWLGKSIEHIGRYLQPSSLSSPTYLLCGSFPAAWCLVVMAKIEW